MPSYASAHIDSSKRDELREFTIAWMDKAKLPLHITVRECGDPETPFYKAMLSSGEEEET